MEEKIAKFWRRYLMVCVSIWVLIKIYNGYMEKTEILNLFIGLFTIIGVVSTGWFIGVCVDKIRKRPQETTGTPLQELINLESDLTNMFDSDVRVGLAILEYIRSNKKDWSNVEQ